MILDDNLHNKERQREKTKKEGKKVLLKERERIRAYREERKNIPPNSCVIYDIILQYNMHNTLYIVPTLKGLFTVFT